MLPISLGTDGPLYQCLGASGRPCEWQRLPISLVNHREQAKAYNYSVSSSPNSNCSYLITYCHRPKQSWECRTLLLPWQPVEKIKVINQRREWRENTQPKQFTDHPCLMRLYGSSVKQNFCFAYITWVLAQKWMETFWTLLDYQSLLVKCKGHLNHYVLWLI